MKQFQSQNIFISVQAYTFCYIKVQWKSKISQEVGIVPARNITQV